MNVLMNAFTDQSRDSLLNKYKETKIKSPAKTDYIMLRVISIYCKALLSSMYLICFAFGADSASLTGPHMLFNICRFLWN